MDGFKLRITFHNGDPEDGNRLSDLNRTLSFIKRKMSEETLAYVIPSGKRILVMELDYIDPLTVVAEFALNSCRIDRLSVTRVKL